MRSASLLVLAAIARCGGAALWRDGGFYWEEATKLAVGCLDDAAQSVREAAGAALGEMVRGGRRMFICLLPEPVC